MSPSRRRLLAAGATGAGLLAAGALTADASPWRAELPLLSSTVALAGPERRVLVHPDGPALFPGSRIVRGAEDVGRLRAAEADVTAAVLGVADQAGLAGPERGLLRDAALDLHVLSVGLAAPVASWARSWRYVWPRDAAHVAVALARLGLVDRAAGVVRELALLCGEGDDAGWFAARYRPGTATAPDARERQLDGTGWFLWALDEVAGAVPGLREEPLVAAAARRCTTLLLALTAGGRSLPPASPDYWEVTERRTTVATAALAAVGLERGGAADAAQGLRERIRVCYGPAGFGRYPGSEGADAGMLFLLPPYALEPDAEVAAHLERARAAMARAAGGVAPGARWRDDGISWTPQTAMFAQARAAIGDVAGTAELVAWLGAHRTVQGSLPEKVLASGRPASVAPLAWTAALLVTTLVGG